MHNARIDSTHDLEGHTVVSACFDLTAEEVAAAVHALHSVGADRYRLGDLSADDVLRLRELTAIADELTERGAGARTVVLSPARLTALREAVEFYNRGAAGPHAGRGRLAPLRLAEQQIDELVAFLKSLDGEGYQDTPPKYFPR